MMSALQVVKPGLPQKNNTFGSISPQGFKPSTPQFGYTAAAALPKANIQAGRLLKAFDFQDLATATITQIKLIYGLCIGSRLYNASRRSKNEVREESIRNSMGYGFWFFATPILQRLFLRKFAPEEYKRGLLEISTKPKREGLKGTLKWLHWQVNPLIRWGLPSSRQIQDQMEQVLGRLKKAGQGSDSIAFQKVEKFYKNGLLKWSHLATALGWGLTVGLLGIVINVYNIYTTKQHVNRGQVGR